MMQTESPLEIFSQILMNEANSRDSPINTHIENGIAQTYHKPHRAVVAFDGKMDFNLKIKICYSERYSLWFRGFDTENFRIIKPFAVAHHYHKLHMSDDGNDGDVDCSCIHILHRARIVFHIIRCVGLLTRPTHSHSAIEFNCRKNETELHILNVRLAYSISVRSTMAHANTHTPYSIHTR